MGKGRCVSKLEGAEGSTGQYKQQRTQGCLSLAPSPSCLPSKGLPLRCPPAKVHSSPTTIQWGLSPHPPPSLGELHPTPQIGRLPGRSLGLASWPEPAQRKYSKGKLEPCLRKKRVDGGWMSEQPREHGRDGQLGPSPITSVKSKP